MESGGKSYFLGGGSGVGKSAYESACSQGFVGTVQQWLDSLHGVNGAPGPAGPQGPKGDTGNQGPQGTPGTNGTNGTNGTSANVGNCWPVGSIFISVVSTDPSVLLGVGTWQAFASGRMLVGFNAADSDFNAAEKTGGSKTVTPQGTVSQPTFTGNSVTSSAVSAGTPAGTINNHTTAADSNTTGGTAKVTGPGTHTFTGSALATHTHTTTATGTVSAPTFTGSVAQIENPYITVFMWKRVS